MTLYRNVGGPHTCLDGTVIALNGTLETDEDLPGKFPGKFLAISPEEITGPEVGVTDAPAQKVESKTSADQLVTETDGPPRYIDVTNKHKSAREAGMRVLEDRSGLWLFDSPDSADPVNDEPLTAKQIAALVKECLG